MDALLFAPVAVAIALTPGPNNFCGLNNGIRAGVGAALVGTLGRAAAFAIFLTVSAVGLGAMLLASEAAFTAVKWVGACYLFWLGWRAWRSREFNGLEVVDGAEVAASAAPVRLIQLDDLLAIPGYTVEAVGKLRDFVIVLPELTQVNVNTAPAEVLAAVIENFSLAEANSLVARRKSAPWRDALQFGTELNGKTVVKDAVSVVSNYFLVRSRVRLDRAALDAEALINRGTDPRKVTTLVWVRQN